MSCLLPTASLCSISPWTLEHTCFLSPKAKPMTPLTITSASRKPQEDSLQPLADVGHFSEPALPPLRASCCSQVLGLPLCSLSMVCHRSESVWTTLLGMWWDSRGCPVSWTPWSLWVSASSGYSMILQITTSFLCCQLLSSLQLLPVSHLTCNSGFSSGLGVFLPQILVFLKGLGWLQQNQYLSPCSRLTFTFSVSPTPALIPVFLPSSKPYEWHYHHHRQFCTRQFSSSSQSRDRQTHSETEQMSPSERLTVFWHWILVDRSSMLHDILFFTSGWHLQEAVGTL